jgi:hypothetical protein
MLDEEIKYFDEHWEEWEAAHPGKYVLIKGTTLLGVYDTIEAAVEEGLRLFYPGRSFLARPLSAHEREVHDAGIVLGVWDANPSCRIDR